MTEVLSARRLNRALLARQLLLKRAALPLTRVIERIGGLQTQSASSGYLSLWSRMRDFRGARLTESLERGRVLQGTRVRATIHMVSAADYGPFAVGIREDRRTWWLRVHRNEVRGLDMEAVAARLRDHLAEGPRRAVELTGLLRAEGVPDIAWSGVGLWLDLVRAPPSGTWRRRRADLFGLAPESSDLTQAQGVDHLVRRYLGGFGPAAAKDIASWAGVALATVQPALDRLRLRRFRDERGGELFDLPRAPLPDEASPAPVRFLPTWEATLLAHARRTQIRPEAYSQAVFSTRNTQSISTFLMDGAVAGTWRYEGGRVRLEPFEPLGRRVMSELREEADSLAAFHRDLDASRPSGRGRSDGSEGAGRAMLEIEG